MNDRLLDCSSATTVGIEREMGQSAYLPTARRKTAGKAENFGSLPSLLELKRSHDVNVAIEIPDEVARQLEAPSGELWRAVLEAVAVEANRTRDDHSRSGSIDSRPRLKVGNGGIPSLGGSLPRVCDE